MGQQVSDPLSSQAAPLKLIICNSRAKMGQRLSQLICLPVEPLHACLWRGGGQWQCPHYQVKAGTEGPGANISTALGWSCVSRLEDAAEADTELSP